MTEEQLFQAFDAGLVSLISATFQSPCAQGVPTEAFTRALSTSLTGRCFDVVMAGGLTAQQAEGIVTMHARAAASRVLFGAQEGTA